MVSPLSAVGRLIALMIALGVVGCGSSKPHQTYMSSATDGVPALASCISAWNTQSSAANRTALDVGVAEASGAPVEVTVATYTGPTVRVPANESKTIVVERNRCIVVGGNLFLIQSASGHWDVTEGIPTLQFGPIAIEQGWSREHANAVASVGPAYSSEVGYLRATGNVIVDLDAKEVNGELVGSNPQTTPSATTTGTTSSEQSTSTPSTHSTSCGVLAYHGEHWTLGEDWNVSESKISCSQALRVLRDQFGGKGTYHGGKDNAESYWIVDGWRCFGPHTGASDCTHGPQTIDAEEVRSPGENTEG